MSNITGLNVTPRTITGKVGKHSYTITYDPAHRAWRWVAKVSVSYDLNGEHKSPELAEAAAKKAIAKFVKTHEDTSL